MHSIIPALKYRRNYRPMNGIWFTQVRCKFERQWQFSCSTRIYLAFEVHRNFHKTCDFFSYADTPDIQKCQLNMRCVAGRLPFVVLLYWKVTHFLSKIKARFSTSILHQLGNNANKDGIFVTFQGGFSSNPTVQPRKWTDFVPKRYQDPSPPTLSLVSLDHLKSIFLRRVIIFICFLEISIRSWWMTRCFHWKPPAETGSESQTRRLMIPWVLGIGNKRRYFHSHEL